jgi:GntR family carbon starvation induced transcriptional regulator
MDSLSDKAYHKIYEEILCGNLRPNQKLHIAQLAKKFEVGLSPVREALSRLTATNLVKAESQRGFKVAPMSLEDLNDIYTTRAHIESIALTLSIEKGGAEWEAALVASFHLLSQTEKSLEKLTEETYNQWELRHRAFNYNLINACGLKHLLQIQEKLYYETERYRRIWVFAGLRENRVLSFSAKQKNIMKAALSRDATKAVSLLVQHYENARRLIAQSLSDRELVPFLDM